MRNIVTIIIACGLLTACAPYPQYTQEPPPTKTSYFKDTDITGNVKQAINSDPVLKTDEIHVQTNGGVVYLTGQVQTQGEIARAVQLATQTPGVKLVESKLIVVPPLK